jgi:hypothetical protein
MKRKISKGRAPGSRGGVIVYELRAHGGNNWAAFSGRLRSSFRRLFGSEQIHAAGDLTGEQGTSCRSAEQKIFSSRDRCERDVPSMIWLAPLQNYAPMHHRSGPATCAMIKRNLKKRQRRAPWALRHQSSEASSSSLARSHVLRLGQNRSSWRRAASWISLRRLVSIKKVVIIPQVYERWRAGHILGHVDGVV